MKLRIERDENAGRGFTGQEYRYFLTPRPIDGEEQPEVEVSHSLNKLKLEIDCEDVNRAQITFLMDDIEIEASALIALTAKVRDE